MPRKRTYNIMPVVKAKVTPKRNRNSMQNSVIPLIGNEFNPEKKVRAKPAVPPAKRVPAQPVPPDPREDPQWPE